MGVDLFRFQPFIFKGISSRFFPDTISDAQEPLLGKHLAQVTIPGAGAGVTSCHVGCHLCVAGCMGWKCHE